VLTQSRYTCLAPFRVSGKNSEEQNASSIRNSLTNEVVETSDVKESNTMKGIAGQHIGFFPKTHSKKVAAVMKSHESHRQGRGPSFLRGISDCGILELKLKAVQERVMIDRSFVNCPRLRHSSELPLSYFQLLTNGSAVALHREHARFEPRGPDVKNSARSERRSCS